MESFAVKEPKRLVIPRSSSFTDVLRRLPLDGVPTRPRVDRRTGGREGEYHVGHSLLRSGAGPRTGRGHCGWLGEVILILPEAMSCLMVSSSRFTSDGTLLSNSWNGARPVPPLLRSPT